MTMLLSLPHVLMGTRLLEGVAPLSRAKSSLFVSPSQHPRTGPRSLHVTGLNWVFSCQSTCKTWQKAQDDDRPSCRIPRTEKRLHYFPLKILARKLAFVILPLPISSCRRPLPHEAA